MKQKVLVVGGAGYLGSVLCKKLLNKGYHVKVLDNLTYGAKGIEPLFSFNNFEFIYGDVRDTQKLLVTTEGVDAVVHLAAIVGDQACEIDSKETTGINYLATKNLVEACKYNNINRFVFASTCSVYGASKTNEMLTETSKLNPVSAYAKSKLESEKYLLEMKDDTFSPTILRMATLHGLSPRMRFDLVVNILTIRAIKENAFSIFGGEQNRAFCHINEASDAYIKCLEAPIEEVSGQIFNIASENMSISKLGNIVKAIIPNASMETKDIQDKRNYMVSSDKFLNIKNNTIKNTISSIKNVESSYNNYKNKKYSNVNHLKEKNGGN